MHPKQLTTALDAAIDLQRPLFVWGPPGVGKSEIIAQVAKNRGMQLRDVRLNLCDPTDIKGFPVPNVESGTMEWLPADFFPPMHIDKTVGKGKTAKIERVPNDTTGILFLDELNQAPAMVQAAAYQLLLTRCVGNYVLPEKWAMVAAGNRETDRSNVQRMPAALALRLIHVDLETSPDDWCDWAIHNSVPIELITFIRFRPDLLHAFDAAQRVSPNPRSWGFCAQLLNRGLALDVEFEMMKGCVGEGAAGEFRAYMDVWRNMPSVDQIKLDPLNTPLGDNAATHFAILGALAKATTVDAYPKFKTYVDRFDPEWQVVYTRDALVHCRDISRTKPFQEFSLANAKFLT